MTSKYKYRVSLDVLRQATAKDDESMDCYVVIHTRRDGRDEPIFRGTLDDCQNYARAVVDQNRIYAAEQDWERF